MLKKQHEVFFALSGLDALGILEREKPGFDAIISDINMADMDGIDLYKNICLKYPGLEKRIVFVTGGIFTTRARDFLKSMPNPLLEKPFASKELLTAISKLG
jgi:two-component system, cell cycle sensor histidine kinase and response regulator CckA